MKLRFFNCDNRTLPHQVAASIPRDGLLDTTGVLIRLNISKRTLENWRNRGNIPFINLHGKLLYEKGIVVELLQKQKIVGKIRFKKMNRKL